jgi:hypothetical protein
VDDAIVSSTREPDRFGEVVEGDNRRWCELFHRKARPDHTHRTNDISDESIRLFVIRRGEAETFAWFRARYGERSDTAVIWDRRVGERRIRFRCTPIERREHERRRSRGAAWEVFGFVLATLRK